MILIFVIKHEAATSNVQISISNKAPEILNVRLCDGLLATDACNSVNVLTLTSNATDENFILINASDGNGLSDISNITVKFYNNLSSESAADDNNDHYTLPCSLLKTYTATSGVYSCSLDLAYYAHETGV